jgi:hypothetical protein
VHRQRLSADSAGADSSADAPPGRRAIRVLISSFTLISLISPFTLISLISPFTLISLIGKRHDETCELIGFGDHAEVAGAWQCRFGGMRPDAVVFPREPNRNDPIERGFSSDDQRWTADARQVALDIERCHHPCAAGHQPRRKHMGQHGAGVLHRECGAGQHSSRGKEFRTHAQ